VNQRGSQIDNWSQVEISLSSLLATLTDAQISIASTAAYKAYLELPPLQVLTHRLDLLCGA
jgi:hypothetical protein